MSVLVKICGIRTIDDVKKAIVAGADFIGLNFVSTSKRRVDLQTAKTIVKNLKGLVQVVGVFQNQPVEYVNKVAQELQLDYVQLHGSESPNYCDLVSTRVIKVFSLESEFDPKTLSKNLKKYQVGHFLFDRQVQGKGKNLNPKLIRRIANSYPIFLAGGLNSQNIYEVVNFAKPFAVDVAGGVESKGKIDADKVRAFIQKAKAIKYY